MVEWIRGLLEARSPGVPDGIPHDWVELLWQRLEPLGEPLARDTLDFVLSGAPQAVLGTVAGKDVGSQLGLTGFQVDKAPAGRLYAQFDEVPPAVALRWCRVLEAATTQGMGRCQMVFERGVRWPELLLVHSSGGGLNTYSGQRDKAQNLTADCMEALCIEDGLSPAAWLLAGLQIPSGSVYFNEQRPLMLTDLVGYPEALARHAGQIGRLILPMALNARLHVLKMLAPAPGAALDCWAPQLAELAASGSKQVRGAVEPLLESAGRPVVEALQQLAVQAKPETRLHALRALARLARRRSDVALDAWTRAAALADKAPAVQALVAEWDDDAAPLAELQYEVEVPVIDWSASGNAVAPEVLARLWGEANTAIDKANSQAREHHARGQAMGHTWPLHVDDPFKDGDVAALQRQLTTDGPGSSPVHGESGHQKAHRFLAPILVKLAQEGVFTPVALVKSLRLLGFAQPDAERLDHVLTRCLNALHRATGRPTLLELSVMLAAYGFSAETLLRAYCARWGEGLGSEWPQQDVWPFFAHHQDQLLRLLAEPPANDWHFSRDGLFAALATLPAPPPPLVNTLFELALGPAKGDRVLAQEALKKQPDKEARIAAALDNGKAEVRARAAQWLGRLRHAAAVPALERAVRIEKNDVAKGALLDALQALGRPVEAYLDRAALDKDAARFAAKGLPKDLDWFPWSALPPVHWEDTGAALSPALLQWLLAQACKQKSAEPNTVLRKLCGLMEPRDREALGQCVLEAWLAEDVRPTTREEAVQRAHDQARQHHNHMHAYPQYYQNDPLFQLTVDEIAERLLPSLMRQPAGSAVASKGLLAVAAACCAERAAPPVQRYLKEWYGTRAAQGKSLIAMLAWIEHPSATQLMLSIGSRFRTKSFQDEATKQAEALAERKGWTLAELADRTIPSAGLDETGILALSFGPRSFTARLLPDFKLELFNPEGKKISALPEPRQDDDQAQAKDAKKLLAAARKELKSIVDLQTDRLYEALCTARDWPSEDWQAYLLQHPVLRHLVQRLVWIQTLPDGGRQAFRPLDDGSLTDVHDDPLELAHGARVALAHDSLVPSQAVGAWQQHLADYAIQPLFQQFGKGSYTLPEGQAGATQVLDFQGHMVEAFALRGRATKLGYTRGNAEDGGWFYTYEKRFPTLGLLAVVEFSGNGLPEENRSVALRHLSFTGTGSNDRWQRASLPLAKVPKVLLSECYDDMRLIAAEGTGFDADWEKKSEP